MEEDVTFSIIVPAYNTEEYIARCLESVFCYAWGMSILQAIYDFARNKAGVKFDKWIVQQYNQKGYTS